MKQNSFTQKGNGQSKKQERHRYWRDLIKNHEESGLRRKTFCDQHAIKLDDFRRWKYRLAKIDTAKQELKTGLPNAYRKNNRHPSFAPVHINKTSSSETALLFQGTHGASSDFKVILSKGTQLIVPSQFNPEALSNLLHCLGEGAC